MANQISGVACATLGHPLDTLLHLGQHSKPYVGYDITFVCSKCKCSHLAAFQCVQFPDVVLHELRNLIQEEPHAAQVPAMQHYGPPDRGVTVFHQHHLLLVSLREVREVVVVARVFNRGLLRSGEPPVSLLVLVVMGMVPGRGPGPSRLYSHIMGLFVFVAKVASLDIDWLLVGKTTGGRV